MGTRLRGFVTGRRLGLVLLAVAAALAAVALVTRPAEPARDGGPVAPPPDGRAGEARGASASPQAERAGRSREPERPERPSEGRRLSDERTRSRWAFVERPTVARARPSRRAESITELTTRTGDRTPELVLALSERTSPGGRTWVRVRLPVRPNNRTGWVERRSLGRYYAVTTFLRIDRERFRATLYDRGRPVWSAPVAVGTEDAPTPPGRFYVRSRIVPRERAGPYGVFAFGTNGFSPGESDWPGGGVVGIHGTDEPGLIPGRVSHGCVRLRNADAAKLRRLMPLGTPIRVS